MVLTVPGQDPPRAPQISAFLTRRQLMTSKANDQTNESFGLSNSGVMSRRTEIAADTDTAHKRHRTG
jgi:hypothetical protein